MYRYIALLNHPQTHRDGNRAGVDEALRQIGLLPRLRTECIDLYASDDTPAPTCPVAAH